MNRGGGMLSRCQPATNSGQFVEISVSRGPRWARSFCRSRVSNYIGRSLVLGLIVGRHDRGNQSLAGIISIIPGHRLLPTYAGPPADAYDNRHTNDALELHILKIQSLYYTYLLFLHFAKLSLNNHNSSPLFF